MRSASPEVFVSVPELDATPAQQRMLEELARLELCNVHSSGLAILCDVGARFGIARLQRLLPSRLQHLIAGKVRRSLRANLRRELMRITKPCYHLELRSYELARQALGQVRENERTLNGLFIGSSPRERLLPMLKRFPVLTHLWFLLIEQWRHHLSEVFRRFAADRSRLSRTFFRGRTVPEISDIEPGLSEPHRGGRNVVRLHFGKRSLIYKPRPGPGEWEWRELIEWMNRHSLRVKLRAAKVLRRGSYCWMENITPASCKDLPAARRFFQRMGELLAVAYFLKAVDCHRENLIASGEFPVLIDTDALWHVAPVTRTQSLTDVLYRTGFFPNQNRRSLQSRSSILGPARKGFHLGRLRGRPLTPSRFASDLTKGFTTAWRVLNHTDVARKTFTKRL